MGNSHTWGRTLAPPWPLGNQPPFQPCALNPSPATTLGPTPVAPSNGHSSAPNGQVSHWIPDTLSLAGVSHFPFGCSPKRRNQSHVPSPLPVLLERVPLTQSPSSSYFSPAEWAALLPSGAARVAPSAKGQLSCQFPSRLIAGAQNRANFLMMAPLSPLSHARQSPACLASPFSKTTVSFCKLAAPFLQKRRPNCSSLASSSVMLPNRRATVGGQ